MATIYDVARAAGVSISTVSYALSNKRSITAETRDRVNEAVRKLGYRPNAGARMLASTTTNILALAAPMHAATHPPAFMAFVLAVVTAARDHDYDVLLLTEGEEGDGLQRVAASSLVDGVVLMDISLDDDRLDLIRELKLPASLIGVPRDPSGLVCVDLDFERAGVMALERLSERGHRDIGLLGHVPALYDSGANFAARFHDSFMQAATQAGVSAAFRPTEINATAVGDALDELWAQLPGLSALVLNCNEDVHRLVLQALGMRGKRVPADVSIVSACASFPTDVFEPALDVIPLPTANSGRRAVELVLDQLRGPTDPRVELIQPIYEAKDSVIERNPT